MNCLIQEPGPYTKRKLSGLVRCTYMYTCMTEYSVFPLITFGVSYFYRFTCIYMHVALCMQNVIESCYTCRYTCRYPPHTCTHVHNIHVHVHKHVHMHLSLLTISSFPGSSTALPPLPCFGTERGQERGNDGEKGSTHRIGYIHVYVYTVNPVYRPCQVHVYEI